MFVSLHVISTCSQLLSGMKQLRIFRFLISQHLFTNDQIQEVICVAIKFLRCEFVKQRFPKSDEIAPKNEAKDIRHVWSRYIARTPSLRLAQKLLRRNDQPSEYVRNCKDFRAASERAPQRENIDHKRENSEYHGIKITF